jgi:hypothetical protein
MAGAAVSAIAATAGTAGASFGVHAGVAIGVQVCSGAGGVVGAAVGTIVSYRGAGGS